MKKLVLLMAILSNQIMANTYEVVCNLKNDFDDWSVSIGSEKASFFDNDSNYAMEFHHIFGENYVYYSNNDYGSYSFFFNQVAMEGTLYTSYENGETGEVDSSEYEFFCGYETGEFW